MLVAKSAFGKRLAELREAAGLSQYQLARQSGVTAQTISRIELEERDPNWVTVLKLARALGVSVADFDDQGEQPATKKKPKK
jgi:transcriptional regulator with XRE-family HTH domain